MFEVPGNTEVIISKMGIIKPLPSRLYKVVGRSNELGCYNALDECIYGKLGSTRWKKKTDREYRESCWDYGCSEPLLLPLHL